MERTVPTTESEEVELYLRTYYSLLRSTADVQIRTLEEVHASMNSLLHPGARNDDPDMSAFIYSMLRLPPCTPDVDLVVLGQSEDVFLHAGFGDVCGWQEVSAIARRRRCYYDDEHTLACFIASRSDIDDIVPTLTAYQIEWNKLHYLLRRLPESMSLSEIGQDMRGFSDLAKYLDIPSEDIDRLYAIWDEDFGYNLECIADRPKNIRIRLLSGSLSNYRQATNEWWSNIEREAPILLTRPVYFISSNIHSTLNLLSGFPLLQTDELVRFLEKPGNKGLYNEWKDIQSGRVPASEENFLYYVFRKFIETAEGEPHKDDKQDHERKLGIVRIPSMRSFNVEAQVFELSKINPDWIDPRLGQDGGHVIFSDSDALILNIDYPLGMAGYHILSEVAEHVREVLGIYVMGKAATLNGVVGDVMIPDVVYDEQSENTYLFPNCFSAADVAPNLIYGTVLDNQKAVSVQGTFLQNAEFMDVFYREGYTDIEMEAGPYLSAVYEMFRPKRHPVNEVVNLYGLPFDLGILNYASDTPLSKGKNLGAGGLSYRGMDATYAVNLAVLRRIFKMEKRRLQNG
ncbi:MAG: hypothetical protein U9R58_01865 [Chloroflexota bacterium]|nr:hypothetical protein [Chloroflexota bacterium]